MSQSESPPPPPRRSSAAKPVQVPPEVMEILVPSMQVGLGVGTVGLFVGATSGILRSTTPVLFSLVTGAQWFALGSSYYGTRRAVIRSWGGDPKVGPADKVKASTLAGASAGFVGGLLPIAVFSVLGAAGQAVANTMPAADAADSKKTSWLDSKWSPVKALSDDEYAKFIDDKILQLEVEISLIDDKLAALRAGKAQRRADERPAEPHQR